MVSLSKNIRRNMSSDFRSSLLNYSSSLLVSQEDEGVDRCSFSTIQCDLATELVRQTRIGQLMYSSRRGVDGGILTAPITVNGKDWGGSEYTVFAKRGGSVTNTHVDGQMVNGTHVLLPAAGIMQSVNRGEAGHAKQAVIMSAEDRDAVIKRLELKVCNPSATQYEGRTLDVKGLVDILKTAGIKFVVCDFPRRCSYVIPQGCPHFFHTYHLVESIAWHPSLAQFGRGAKESEVATSVSGV